MDASTSTVDPRRHAGAARRRAELRDQPARLEQRREDPVGELLHLRQRPPRFALQLVEERLRRRRIGVHRSRGDLQVGRERHQILLHAIVQRSLDAASFGIGGQRESFPRGSELLDLAAQPIEGWLLVGLLDLHRIPPAPGSPAVVRHRPGGVKRPARYRTGWQHPRVRQAATVEPAGTTS